MRAFRLKADAVFAVEEDQDPLVVLANHFLFLAQTNEEGREEEVDLLSGTLEVRELKSDTGH